MLDGDLGIIKFWLRSLSLPCGALTEVVDFERVRGVVWG